MALDVPQVETELKLRLSPKAATRLLASPVLRLPAGSGLPAPARLRTIYFDSPDHALWRQGAALRLRRMGRRWIQSLKEAGSEQAGLHQHTETEREVPGPVPALEYLPGAIRQALAGHEGALAPVFETEIRRTSIPLILDDGRSFEIAIDRGRIKAGGAVMRVCEVELEIKHGPAESAFALARELLKNVPFVLEHRTKAERGYALAEHRAPALSMARPISLTPDMPANLALALAAGEGLRHMGANEAVARLGEDIEGVHQMRVGLRRLKVALSLAHMVRPDPARDVLRAELGWAGDVLGRARDLDVFDGETLRPLHERAGDSPELLRLVERAATLRRRAYDELRAALDSPRYTEMQLRIGAWIAGLASPSPDDLSYPPLIEVAVPLLTKRRRQIRKFAKRHGWQTKTELHELRLHAKKLRYTASFFAPLFPRKRTKTFIGHLAELQEMLGLAHDGEVARAMLVALGTRQSPEAEPRAAWRRTDSLIEGWHLARSADLASRIDAAWHTLEASKPFW